jgi:hypothetical protein
MQFSYPELLTLEGLRLICAFLDDLAFTAPATTLLSKPVTTPLAYIERLVLVEDTIDVELAGSTALSTSGHYWNSLKMNAVSAKTVTPVIARM